MSRGISEVQIRDSIIKGRELPFEHKGQKGGYISKFYMSFLKRDGNVTISKSVVAVCETFSDRYVVVSCYQEQQRT
jgi:hypothetical protein